MLSPKTRRFLRRHIYAAVVFLIVVEGAFLDAEGFPLLEMPPSLKVTQAASWPWGLQEFSISGGILAGQGRWAENGSMTSLFGRGYSSESVDQEMLSLNGPMQSASVRNSLLGDGFDIDSIFRHDFTMQAGGGFSPLGMGGAMQGQPGLLGLRVIPYLMLAERYDSNVFFAPALPGLNRQDYVTSFSPGVVVFHNSRLVNTSLQLGASGEYYAVHPGLNYVGFNGTLTLTMNELARRVFPGASLLVAQSGSYSPYLAGFTPDPSAGGGVPVSQDVDVTTALVRSTQLYRVNTLTTTSTIAGSVPLSSSVLFQANYGYSIFRFGTPSVNEASGGTQAQVINSTSHSAQAGPSWRISSVDTLSLRGVFENGDYGGGQGGYRALGASVGWTRMISQFFNFRLYGGATTVEQDFGASIGAGVASTSGVAYTGGAAVMYVGGPQTVTVNYTLGIAPSFIAAVGPLQTHIVQLTAIRRLSEAVSISGGFTYNHSKAVESTINLPGTFFESYSGYGTVSYRFATRYSASLSYTAGVYSGNYFTTDVVTFGRNAVTLMVTAYGF